MTRYALALAASWSFACNGCNDGRSPPVSPASSETAAPSATAPAPGETLVRAEDDGKTFDAARGTTVTFKLASNAGTGYVWMLTQVDASILAQQGDRTSEVMSTMPGGPKADVYHFMAGSAGSTVVEMSLKRPFGSAPAARAIHVTVNVR